MIQEWRQIAGYEGWYEVGSLGEVRSVPRLVVYTNGKRFNYKGTTLRPATTPDGYRRVSLTKSGNARSFLVHRLVALTFIPNPLSKPEVNHKRGAAAGDSVDNLEWATASENVKHSIDFLHSKRGLLGKFGADHPRSKPILIGPTLYAGIREAARQLGIAHSSITSAIERDGAVLGMKAKRV